MFRKYMLVLVALMLLPLASYSGAALVGSSSIRAPAVIINNNTGSLTNITLRITNGTGKVSVIGPENVGSSTLQSANTAAEYASNYTNRSFYDYNFTYEIMGAGENVSGPSAGAAMTMLAISAFEGRPLRNDFTMTGTISPNGTIGEIGGVYDKVSAAQSVGIMLVLVPKVQPTDPEDELYLLVQTNFGIPLVQVANISQASYFAFNSSINGTANRTTYNFYKDYHASELPNATLQCTESCNYSIFNTLLNATFNLTRNEINGLNANPKFSNISSQLGDVLNQSAQISKHGYIYTSADFAFLDYVNAFYFSGYPSNRSSALSLLYKIQSLCTSLTPPPLTSKNYNYVISAELRQEWGNYTINQVISSYNSSSIESDEILDELYLGAQANGWCTAANLVYSESSQNYTGTYLLPSESLKAVAYNRIQRALPYGSNLYIVTAQQAYNQDSYPLAILDADYAYALSNASTRYTLSAAQLNALSTSIADNSTYGVWATEFAKEVQFYVSESNLTTNSSLAKSYAESGYSAALLAQQLSNDTYNINQNLMVEQQTQQQGNYTQLVQYITFSQELIFALLLIVIAMLMINTVLIIMVMKNNKPEAKGRNRKRRQK